MKKMLRWMAVPLAAIGACCVGYWGSILIQSLCFSWVLPTGWISSKVIGYYLGIVGALISGVCFVSVGTMVAPTNKKNVSIILATFMATMMPFSLFFSYLKAGELTFSNTAGTVVTVVGAVACAYYSTVKNQE